MRTRAIWAAGTAIAVLGTCARGAPMASGAAAHTGRGQPACREITRTDAASVTVRTGGTCASGRYVRPAATVQPTAIHGDFDGDRRTDVLLYAPGAEGDHLWYATTSGFVAGRAIAINGDYDFTVGDFNGDGHDDIFWFEPRHPPASSVWWGASRHRGFNQQIAPYAPAPTATDAYVPGAGDFNGDHRADVLWLDVGSGGAGARSASFVWFGATRGFNVAKVSVPTPPCNPERAHVAVCVYMWRDFNNDGRADFLYYRSGPDSDGLWYSTGPGWRAGPPINIDGFYEPIRGDFNGDGRGDIIWYAPGRDSDYIWYGRASGFVTGPPIDIDGTYTVVRGDFNGDGKDDIVWYAPGLGHDYLWYGTAHGFRNGPQIAIVGFYTPFAKDYNGDGKTDILWYAVLRGHRSHLWYGATSGFRHAVSVNL